MKFKFLVLVFSLASLKAFACLSAGQHKLFPVGTYDNNNILFIEAHIHRTEDYGKNDAERHMLKMKWRIKSYISIYDTSQNLISQTEIESSEIKGDSYLPLLQSTYTKGLLNIKSLFSDLVYFEVEYLSFCDYQKKCNKIELTKDSTSKKDFFKYNGKSYNLQLNASEKDKESAFFIDEFSAYYLNSIRIYKTKHTELIIGHLATGHQVSMGYINNDLSKKTSELGDSVHKAKPYPPGFEYKELHTAVYQEPILHHGNGYDLFIVVDD